jgi:serine/threonine-protein kinase
MGSILRERWHDVSRVLDGALTLPPDARAAYLDRACAGDSALRGAVVALLDGAEAATFLERPAAAYAAPVLAAAVLAADRHAGLPNDAADATPPPSGDVRPGSLVGPYRAVRELGRGGMGAVYLAERADGQFAQRVALKLIRRGLDGDAVHARFLRERQILARLQHPGIARLGDGGITDGGQPWFAMEYVDGATITAHCERNGLTVAERVVVFLRVCEAVQYAHRSLVVHRDLKPSNILVTAAGEVKLLDFGIAKLLSEGDDTDDADDADAARTEAGVRLMTPDYAAPEQVRGELVTTATDVYALGAVLYELLTGRRAHRIERRTPAEVERVVCTTEPAAPSAVAPPQWRRALRGDLDTIVATALRKEPARRYASVEALAEDLRRYAAGLPVRARSDSRTYRAGKFVRRHGVAVAAAAAVFLALAGGLAGTLWQARAAGREAAKATEVKEFVVGLFEVADPADSRGREVTARELLERGRRRVDSALARQPAMREELLGVLSGIHAALGLYAQADSLAERAALLGRALHGDRSPEAAARLTAWGATLWQRGEYARAESVLAGALAIRRRAGDDTLLAQTLNVVGSVYSAKGELDRAVASDREIIALDRRHYGDAHLEVATDLTNFGVHLRETGALAEADSALRAALAIQRRQLDASHPDVLITQHNLALVLGDRGQLDESERLERHVLEQRRRLYPRGHPDVAFPLHQLATIASRRGRLEEADSLLAEAVAIRRQWLGSGHPETMASLNNRVVVAYRMGRFPEAEVTAREVLANWRRTLGLEHRYTLGVLTSLGGSLREQGRYAEAEPMLRQALAGRRKLFGDSSEEVAHGLMQLGRLLRLRGGAGSVEAEPVLRESIALYRRVLPAGDQRVAPPLANLGAVLTDLGRASEGEPLLREAVTIQEREAGKDAPGTATIRRSYALCLTALGRHREAEVMLLESYRALAAWPYGERERRETARRLAAFYTARGRHAEAAKYR